MGKKMFVFTLAVLALTFIGSTSTYDYETIVVGMGTSGVVLTNHLQNFGHRMLILEASNHIGGRFWTQPYGKSFAEVEPDWIMSKTNSSLQALANDLRAPVNLDIIPYRSNGKKCNRVQLIKKLVVLTFQMLQNPPNPPEMLGKFTVRKLTEYLRKKHPNVLDDQDFMTEFFNFLELIILSYQNSDSWNDVTTDSNYKHLRKSQDTKMKISDYASLFFLLILSRLPNPNIPFVELKLRSPVKNVNWSTEGVLVETGDGNTYTAKNAIVTVSLGVLKDKYNEMFSPPLPQEKIYAIKRIGFGVCDKVTLRFEEDWWGGSNYGFIWQGEDKTMSQEDSWMTKISGVFTPVEAKNVLVVRLCGDAARKMELLPENEVKNKVMKVIRKFLGYDFFVPDPIEMKRSMWFTNPYVRGTASYDDVEYNLHPGIRSTLGEPLADDNGINRVYFAGEATMDGYYSIVKSGIDSGHRAAERVLEDKEKETRNR